jgi:hypothetical protein
MAGMRQAKFFFLFFRKREKERGKKRQVQEY